jgi:flagellar motor protein MotB
MRLFPRHRSAKTPWLVFTDLALGLFTVFLFAFISLWVLKNVTEQDLVAKNEAFTRKEVEFQSCVDERELARAKILNYEKNLGEKLKAPIEQGLLVVTDGKIDIQESILFGTGRSQINPDGAVVISQIASALSQLVAKDTSFMIMVAGYTDNVPIKNSKYYPTNWHLSASRAMNVVQLLISAGYPPDKVFSAGFGEFQPKVPNLNTKNRSINRRVEIVRVPMEKNRFSFDD